MCEPKTPCSRATVNEAMATTTTMTSGTHARLTRPVMALLSQGSSVSARRRCRRRSFRRLEAAVEHRQKQHDDAHPDDESPDQVHAGVGDVVAEDDSGDSRRRDAAHIAEGAEEPGSGADMLCGSLDVKSGLVSDDRGSQCDREKHGAADNGCNGSVGGEKGDRDRSNDQADGADD